MSKPPKQKPGSSEQDVQTPKELLDAIRERLFIKEFAWDLAANATNTVVPDLIVQNTSFRRHFNEEDDAIVQDWHKIEGWLWCNPPYKEIAPWVHKAYNESGAFGAHVAMLVPASVGSNWWAENVHNKAQVLFVRPRVTFVWHTTPYPKDLAVLLYTPQRASSYHIFGWK